METHSAHFVHKSHQQNTKWFWTFFCRNCVQSNSCTCLLAYYPFVDFAETFFSTFSTLFCLPLSIFRFFLCKQTHHRQLSTNIRMINMVSTLFFTPYLHSVILKGSLFCAKDHVWLSYRMHCFWFDELIVIVKLCSSHSQCH